MSLSNKLKGLDGVGFFLLAGIWGCIVIRVTLNESIGMIAHAIVFTSFGWACLAYDKLISKHPDGENPALIVVGMSLLSMGIGGFFYMGMIVVQGLTSKF